MKRFLLIFVSCVILNTLSGCVNQRKRDPKLEYLKEYFAAKDAAKNSPQTIKKIFLDFEFGMSAKEVENHFKTLLKAGKIHIDRGRNLYYYSFHTQYGEAKMTLAQAYHNDSLYSLECRFIGDDNNLSGSKKLCILDAASKFRDAHPDYKSWIVTLEGLEDFDPDYYDIKDNVIVHFDMLRGTMTYTNAPILKRVEQEKEQREQNTISDF